MSTSFPPVHVAELNQQKGDAYSQLVELMRRLLAEDGCPWDQQQTIESLKRYTLEEACEVMDAIDSGDRENLKEELGDLALQIVFLTELAQREGSFGHDDVMADVVKKMVRRHPHVFSDQAKDVKTSADVDDAWAAIKAKEKKLRPLLDQIPQNLPALEAAHRIGSTVEKVGFDWPDLEGSLDKVREEFAEFQEAIESKNQADMKDELGDVFFALSNYARHLGINPEAALAGTNKKFRNRFSHVEKSVRARHVDWPRDSKGKPDKGVSLEEMDGYWEDAKRIERDE